MFVKAHYVYFKYCNMEKYVIFLYKEFDSIHTTLDYIRRPYA